MLLLGSGRKGCEEGGAYSYSRIIITHQNSPPLECIFGHHIPFVFEAVGYDEIQLDTADTAGYS